MKGRPQQIAALREEPVQRAAAVFDAAAADGEAHVAAPGRDPELCEQRAETRIGPVVEYEETGVHRYRPVVGDDVHRIGVTADVRSGLEYGDLVRLRKPAGDHIARDAGPDTTED